MEKFKSQSGQMLLIVVLVMVVALTVALSVATRSITNVKISKQNEESQRAFQAAEAGLEINIRKALEGNNVVVGSDKEFNNNASFKIDPPVALASQGDLNAGDPVLQDRGIDVWLTNYDTYKAANATDPIGNNVSVTLHWGDRGISCNEAAAIEVLVLVGTSKKAATIEKHVYDPSCPGYVNGTKDSWTNSAEPKYQYKMQSALSITNGIVMKVVPIGRSTKMFIDGTTLPPQGKLITSEGKAGETVRKLEYTQFFPELPTEMFYALLTQ